MATYVDEIEVTEEVIVKLLQYSVEKWEEIAEEKIAEKGAETCALCLFFLSDNCERCPVKERTGRINCVGSPFIAWRAHHAAMHSHKSRMAYCPVCKIMAKQELNFLKSLLEEKQTTVKNV